MGWVNVKRCDLAISSCRLRTGVYFGEFGPGQWVTCNQGKSKVPTADMGAK